MCDYYIVCDRSVHGCRRREGTGVVIEPPLREPGTPGPPGRLDQIGVVVDDLDRAAAGMRTVFDLQPRSRVENVYRRTEYRGMRIDGRSSR